MKRLVSLAPFALPLLAWGPAFADLALGPEEIVQASGADLVVPGYSVPSLVLWNGDELPDLVVGEGGGTAPTGKVRIYLNGGSAGAPEFTTFSYAQADGSDLVCVASGCMGCFPRVVRWDGDERKDLIVGQSDGTVKLFLNTNTDEAPAFDAGTLVPFGDPGHKAPIAVGYRAAPAIVDWDGDGRKDLVVGAYDGRIHVFRNEGTETEPDFFAEAFAEEDGSPLTVPSGRSSPCVLDLTNDGREDLITGNTDGRLLLYANVSSGASPAFSGRSFVRSDGDSIDLAGAARSRPFVCAWDSGTVPDVLIGAGDGKVRLYRATGFTDGDGTAPRPAVRLVAVRPNPFNPKTTVTFQLAAEARARVVVFDAAGGRVARLADRISGPGDGTVVWTGVDDTGLPVPSGVYLVRVETGRGAAVGRAVLVR